MARKSITLISEEQALTLASAAYAGVLDRFPQQHDRHLAAWLEARSAVIKAYASDTFCVARESPAHKAIRDQAREAANAASATNRQ